MIITEDKNSGQFRIKSYEPGKLVINDQEYERSVIIGVEQLKVDWPPQSLEELNASHWEALIELNPAIVLLGTGATFKRPAAEILAPLYEQQINVEYMDTANACRTFMALASEGRDVIAALLIR